MKVEDDRVFEANINMLCFVAAVRVRTSEVTEDLTSHIISIQRGTVYRGVGNRGSIF